MFEGLVGVLSSINIGQLIHTQYDGIVTNAGYAVLDTIEGQMSGLTAWQIYRRHVIGLMIGTVMAMAFGRLARAWVGGESIGEVLSFAGRYQKSINAHWEIPPGRGRSIVDDRLPIRVSSDYSESPVIPRDGKTRAVFDDHAGSQIPIQSGIEGPGTRIGSYIRTSSLSAEARNSLTHVEGHAVAVMHEHNLPESTIFINYVGGPCESYCMKGVPELLGPGKKLNVVYPRSEGPTGEVGWGYFDCNGWHPQM
jgi:hypothetical protein